MTELRPYKSLNIIVSLMIVVLLPLILLFSCINMVTYDINHYKIQYNRFSISREMDIDDKELMIATENLLDYIKDRRSDLNFQAYIKGEKVEFFSDRDKLHMIDVKNIFKTIRVVRDCMVLLIFLALFIKYKKRLNVNMGKCFIFSSVIGTLPFLLLILLIFVDFNKYFTVFHEIFFSNDLWLLDPKADRLVNVFPEEFFSYTAIKILIYYFCSIAITFIIGIFSVIRNKKHKVLL